MKPRLMLVVAAIAIGAGLAPAAAEAQAALTYYKDVAPIIRNHCQACHRSSRSNLGGLLAPMPLMSYEDTRPWARAIASKVRSREMPPWFADEPRGVFKNERGLTDAEIATLVDWVEAGAPAGDRTDAPPAPAAVETTVDGWMLGKPDFVVRMEEPYVVPDDAFNVNLAVDVRIPDELLPEDTWVRGWEVRAGADGPGVHHMCVFVRPEDGRVLTGTTESAVPFGGLLNCVAEGAESGMLPDGWGRLLEKQSVVNFNMHFYKEPGPGTSFSSQPEVGFFVEKRPVRHKVLTDTLANNGFEIPPNVANYRVGMARTLQTDILVLSYWPHAHLRGTAVKYVAFYPDGTDELLLDVPRYDQDWQVTYDYAEPKLLPKGTRIEAQYWFDNTEERGVRRGYNANRATGFGSRTNDEMAFGFLSYAEVDGD